MRPLSVHLTVFTQLSNLKPVHQMCWFICLSCIGDKESFLSTSGHYSYLDDSDTSGYPSESKLFSPFLQANVSLCMEFAYSLESPTGSYTLHVNKRDPQLQEVWTFPVEVTGGKWGSQFLFLGQGLYQIYFSATVKSGDNSGHIALDDVRIDRCTAFGKYFWILDRHFWSVYPFHFGIDWLNTCLKEWKFYSISILWYTWNGWNCYCCGHNSLS